ncbi:MAG: hypothetical protein COA58_16695 [Bacteroidetes bacterium]|nr:MAG: hypothetical protein COA58_16695 [Bacteroidota bacterium]
MYVWRHIPLLRFLIPFILGILVTKEYDLELIPVFSAFILLCSILLIGHLYLKNNISRVLIYILSLVGLCATFLSGILVTENYQLKNFSNHFSHQSDADFLLVRVVSNPEEKRKSIGCQLAVCKLYDSDTFVDVQGLVQGYFEKDSLSLGLNYGDYLCIQNTLKPIEEAKNPHQFDFKKFYNNKNIYHQGYFRSGSWVFTGAHKSSTLFSLSYYLQDQLRRLFNRYFKDESVKGVAQAIVFGYREDLDEDWMRAFSKTGTIHVLAVSGLHIGIIYILLSSLIGLGRSRGKWLIVKSIVVIVSLFIYCLVTGFAPSVSRAALMFGIVICGNAWNRNSNIYNTLTFAAFVLLVFNPLNLYNVGFQFSFLAVIGIVFYKDYFSSFWPQSSWLGNKVISLLSVSVAAQITTFPIGLYYFHQYPNLFMFSNLIVIPFITVILYSGIFFIAVGFWSDWLAQFLSKIISIYIQFISSIVHYIQDIPFAFFENVHITFSQMLLIYALIVAVTFTVLQKWRKGFVLVIVLSISFLVSDYVFERSLYRTEVVCFDVRNETLIGFRQNKQIVFLASKGIYESESKKLEFIVNPYLINERLTDNYSVFPLDCINQKMSMGFLTFLDNGTIWFNNKSYMILDKTHSYINNEIKGDFLIIGSKKGESYIKKVIGKLDFKNIVILDSWKSAKQIRYIDSHLLVIEDDGCVILRQVKSDV